MRYIDESKVSCFQIINANIKELAPIIYTPIVGKVCQVSPCCSLSYSIFPEFWLEDCWKSGVHQTEIFSEGRVHMLSGMTPAYLESVISITVIQILIGAP